MEDMEIIILKLSFIVYYHHVFKNVALCTCSAGQDLMRFYEDG